ncbi:MAG TPA: tetratricopeptide repeat protein [Burkholderiales bacterium]|nr:tetratricopeptide repeat protein [Burkholderiales bacterium]
MLRGLFRRLAGSDRGRAPELEGAERLIAEARKAEGEGRLQEACVLYREAVAAAPQYAAAHLNLGVGLEAAGDRDGAAESYRIVLALDPDNAYAHYNLGKLWFLRRDFAVAERHLRTALKLKPDFADAYVVLSNLHDAKDDFPEAASLLELALRHRPDYAGAWFNYATALVKLDRMTDAEHAARQTIRFDPGFLRGYIFLGDLLRTDARLEEAVEVFGRARSLEGGGLACEQAELHALNYFDGISDEALFERHKQVGARMEAEHPVRFGALANAPDPERRLRIGYVSRDLHRHPVALFLIPVLQLHDRSRYEVFCYATSPRSDDVTLQARSLADRWLDAAKLSSAELADAIHKDGVDILVDLLGHAGSSDLSVFAQQPAPVQVTWLGYLNTTGLTRMHYRLCDGITDPPGIADRLHTEKLVRLPNSQWCYRPYKESELSARHALEPPCVRNGFVTFGSFNHRIKLSRTVLALWARILQELADSRLVILGVPTGAAQERVVSYFEQQGIAPSRIRVVPPVTMNDYFLLFDDVDLALDATPYSGGTTSCETIWMGVPLVTLCGSRSVSRSAASILTMVGLDDWIAYSAEEYVQLALRHARDESLLRSLRASLRDTMRKSPLMDEARFARDLESAYRGMWHTWCEGRGAGRRA